MRPLRVPGSPDRRIAAFVNSATKGAQTWPPQRGPAWKARHAHATTTRRPALQPHRTRLLAIARRNSASPRTPKRPCRTPSSSSSITSTRRRGAGALAWLTLTLKRRCWALYHRPRLAHPDGAAPVRRRRRPSAQTSSTPLGFPTSWPRSTSGSPECEAAQHTEAHRARSARPARARLQLPRNLRATGWTYTKVNRCLVEGSATATLRRQGLKDATDRRCSKSRADD